MKARRILMRESDDFMIAMLHLIMYLGCKSYA